MFLSASAVGTCQRFSSSKKTILPKNFSIKWPMTLTCEICGAFYAKATPKTSVSKISCASSAEISKPCLIIDIAIAIFLSS